jgi:hypothetical protein
LGSEVDALDLGQVRRRRQLLLVLLDAVVDLLLGFPTSRIKMTGRS